MESQCIEYKKSFGKEVIITLTAFANTEGGRVVVGMADSGVVCGVEVGPETVQRYLNEIKVGTYPQLQDVSRMHALGWKHQVGLDLGVRTTYQWYLESLKTN